MLAIDQPFKDVAAAGGVIFQTDGGEKPLLVFSVDDDGVVGFVRKVLAVKLVAGIGV